MVQGSDREESFVEIPFRCPKVLKRNFNPFDGLSHVLSFLTGNVYEKTNLGDSPAMIPE
jgi:hypothetical protein